ncbi:MAG: hypothetical protein RIS70_2749 [Planctomycetota bacterium]
MQARACRQTVSLKTICLQSLIIVSISGCGADGGRVKVKIPGVRTPVTYGANEVKLSDDQVILGVLVDGKARAYFVQALALPSHDQFRASVMTGDMSLLGDHLVNDIVNNVPISVSYCDSTDCKAVFTQDGTAPIDLYVGGTDGDRMLLMFRGERFPQDAELPPLDRVPHQLLPWGEWKSRYPRTDIYLGRYAPEFVIDYVDPRQMGPQQ